MKKRTSALLVLILATALCALCLPSCAYGEDREYRFGTYRYTVENEQVTITKYTGAAANVTVPESIDGMPVVAIGDQAFDNLLLLKSVTLPDSIVRIDFWAFHDCPLLERITLGRGVRVIGSYLLASCDNVIYNEYEGGYYVGNDENPYMALVSVASTEAQAFTFHPDTVLICGGALRGCYKLRDIAFPDGVLSLGTAALEYCSSLETVRLPKSVESIGSWVFERCKSLQSIVVAEDNPHFKSVDGALLSGDGSRLIKYAGARTDGIYHIPDGTVTIDRLAFERANHLTRVIFPDSVEMIGHQAFLECENLADIQFGKGLKMIDGQAFGFCSSLTEVVIPDSVEELSYSVFSECKSLETVVIGSGVTSLGHEAFLGCDALREVTFKDPGGWKYGSMYRFPKSIDVSDPEQNAKYLTGEYRGFAWFK